MARSTHRFRDGLQDGIPIALGYLPVSFGFGISAVGQGLGWLSATIISLTNVTSAGQLAGLAVIIAGGPLSEMILTQLVANIRYFLMGISMGQRLDEDCNLARRFLLAFGVTDEIFAVSMARGSSIGPQYLYGLYSLPVLGWVTGTLLGGLAGEILPAAITAALGIAIYGMFVAIVVPEARKRRPVLLCVCLSIVISCIARLLGLSDGFSVILAAVTASAAAAWLHPIDGEKEAAQ